MLGIGMVKSSKAIIDQVIVRFSLEMEGKYQDQNRHNDDGDKRHAKSGIRSIVDWLHYISDDTIFIVSSRR